MTPCFLVDCHQPFGGESTFSLQILPYIYLTLIYTPLPVEPNLPLQLYFTRVEMQTAKFHFGQIFIQTRRKFRVYFQRLTSIRIRVHSCPFPPQITERRAICIK
jgi:hypothetical protein